MMSGPKDIAARCKKARRQYLDAVKQISIQLPTAHEQIMRYIHMLLDPQQAEKARKMSPLISPMLEPVAATYTAVATISRCLEEVESIEKQLDLQLHPQPEQIDVLIDYRARFCKRVSDWDW